MQNGKMKGSIQWTEGHAGILRVHTGTDEIPWPWSWACTIDVVDNNARIYAAHRAPTRAELRCIREALISQGVKSAEWERDKRDGVHLVKIRSK